MRVCKKCGESKPFELFSKKLKGYQPKCKPCSAIDQKEWYSRNRDSQLDKKKASYEETRQVCLNRQKEYYENNREERLAYARKWREENQDYIRADYEKNKDRYKAAIKNWRSSNPQARRVQEVARRARLRWIPPWADRAEMARVYKEAKSLRDLGVDCHVDHIVPLRGKFVSGLHTHNNLRIVLAEDNLKKGSSFVESLL